ncbi:MAG: NADH-quinone oxidoreductase subunit J [Actinomycetales bacterium]
MSHILLVGVPLGQPTVQIGTGEAVLFWILAPLMVLASLGLLLARKAVYGAVLIAFVMIALAALYAAQDAPFLFAAQIVVYTGAVMMLFLFVLMLVGVDTADEVKEAITGQRWIGALAGLGLAFFLVAGVVGVDLSFNEARLLQLTGWAQPATVGLEAANADTNPVGVAREVFGPYVFTFEVVGTLLIIAAVGAIVLTHSPRLGPKRDQRHLSTERVREGTQVTPLPPPGVYARHNAVDTPALLPDGSASELSVSRVLRARGQEADSKRVAGQVEVIAAELEDPKPHSVSDEEESTP